MAHPIHPALAHFPVACWSLCTIGDIASLALADQRVWFTSGVLLVIGLAAAVAAMVAGLFELGKIAGDSAAMQVANWHMYLVVAAWSLYALSLSMRLNGSTFIRPNGVAIGLSVLGFSILCAAGWLGGTLVYGHGVGVNARHNPESH
ncbi:MAG TPA: DUF2231 domain-containing protein [Gallionellaceae bacterium]